MNNGGSLYIAALVLATLTQHAGVASGSDVVVAGRVRHQGVIHESGSSSTFETTTERYVVVAGSADVGTVVALDHELVQSLCADVDGCAVVFQMVNKFGSQPGNVHSETAHLFLSETSSWWRLSTGVAGQDDNDATSQWDSTEVDECRFTDAESPAGTNTALDSLPGFGLLNLSGGTTDGNSCRLMLSD